MKKRRTPKNKKSVKNPYDVALGDFYRKFGTKKFYEKCYKREQRLSVLKEFADLIICYVRNDILKPLREQFDKSDLMKSELGKWGGCSCCGYFSEVRHHIISLGHGGENEKRNIILLCRVCHGEIHPWIAQPDMSPVLLR